MSTVGLVVCSGSGDRPVDVDVRMALLAGYTGRDQDAVRAHVAELARQGIPAPARIPSVFPVPGTRIVTAEAIDVCGPRTAGEAEFVLLQRDGELLVGVGSDHTDRELEEHSVLKSKQACDKPVSAHAWPHSEVAGHWDRLRLRADVRTGDGWAAYQDGTLGEMLAPQQLLEEVGARCETPPDVAVFSGTLPLAGGEFRYGTGFRATLEDPVLARRLVCEYDVRELPALDG